MQDIQKRFTKQIFSVVIVAVMALTFGLVGCSSNNASNSNSSSAPAAEQKAPQTITVNLTVNDLEGNSLFDGAVEVEPDSNVLNVLENSGVDFVAADGSYGPYITSIAGVEAGPSSGWTDTINDESPTVGVAEQTVADGDVVAFAFVEYSF